MRTGDRPDLADIAAEVAARQDDMLADLEPVVRCQSPSGDLAALISQFGAARR